MSRIRHIVTVARARPGRALVAAIVVLALVATSVAAWSWWRESRVTDFERAVALAPAETARLTYVDWAALRAELDVDLAASSSLGELDDLLSRGFEQDLTMPSALLESASVLHERFGFSPATVEWESLAQAPEGAVITLALPETLDLDALRSRLVDLGYGRPQTDDGVWVGGSGLVGAVGNRLSPILANVALLDDRGLLLGSDNPDYLDRAVAAATGDDALAPEPVVRPIAEPVSAIYFVGDFACSALAMSQAGDDARGVAADLVRDAGKVNPYRGLVIAARPGGTLRATFGFASGDQARTNAASRARLAEGPASGQGGAYTERFTLDAATATGEVVTLDLTPREGRYVFSDLTQGPVLLATC